MKSAPDSETLQIKDCDFGSYVDPDQALVLDLTGCRHKHSNRVAQSLSVGKMKKP
jgi:hypothetical protein